MGLDLIYTNGVIAVKERYLLGDTILRLCETDAFTAFRTLCERGFGGGVETATDVYSYEKLVEKEEANIDAFVHEYAPTIAEKAFFLAPRDFHNAKALLKARYLKTDAKKMLAAEGLVPVSLMQDCLEKGVFTALENPFLETAFVEGLAALDKEVVSGAEIGEIFEKQLRLYLQKTCKKNKTLKGLIEDKTDMLNILTAFRCKDVEEAKAKFLPGGNFTKQNLEKLFSEDTDKMIYEFALTPWSDFIRLCIEESSTGKPLVKAEKLMDGYETEYFYKRRYELQAEQPFLYYISRRKTENANVRIVLACLLAGVAEADIKKRLRGV